MYNVPDVRISWNSSVLSGILQFHSGSEGDAASLLQGRGGSPPYPSYHHWHPGQEGPPPSGGRVHDSQETCTDYTWKAREGWLTTTPQVASSDTAGWWPYYLSHGTRPPPLGLLWHCSVGRGDRLITAGWKGAQAPHLASNDTREDRELLLPSGRGESPAFPLSLLRHHPVGALGSSPSLDKGAGPHA